MHITYSEAKTHPTLAYVNQIFIEISSSHINENLDNNLLSYDTIQSGRGTSCIHPQGKTAAIIKRHSEESNLKLLLTNARNQNKLGDPYLPGCCHVDWEIVTDISGEQSANIFSANQSTPLLWSA